jgi:hypothetical protein
MRAKSLLTGLVLAAGLASQARADFPTPVPPLIKDLIPVSLSFRRVLADDVGGAKVLRITLTVKNIGKRSVHGSRGGVMIGAIWNTSVGLYGPAGGGGYNLGAPIAPGQTGMFLLEAPLSSLRRCQKTKVQIDTTRVLQSGPESVIYLNDSKVMIPNDTDSPVPCHKILHP